MRRILLLTLAAAMLAPLPLRAQTTAKSMYARLQGREQTARRALEQGGTSDAVRKELVRVVAGYEGLVVRFPRSGYSDNALWQGAMLAASSYARFRVEADRTQAVHLLKRLTTEYPTSSLSRQARPALARLSSSQEAAPARASTPAPPVAPVAPERSAPAPAPLAARQVAETLPPAPPPVAPPLKPVAASAAAMSASSAPPAQLRAVRRTVLPDVVRVAIELDREVDYHDDRINGPDRIFVDLQGTEAATGVKTSEVWDDGVVKAVRVGARGAALRVVLDLDAVSRYSVFTLYNPFRVVVDLDRRGTMDSVAKAAFLPPPPSGGPAKLDVSSKADAAARSEALAKPEPAADPILVGSVSNEKVVIPVEDALKPAPQVESVAAGATIMVPPPAAPPLPATRAAGAGSSTKPVAEPVPAPPALNLQGHFSLSRQLGLGISRIVIDPGHGGHDPGAQTRGLNEADLVLDVALRLEQLLAKTPGVEVVLTRRTNVFVPLEERTAIANREGADLFLSIHANASRNPKARGVETYFLNFASNPDAEAVAARENSASGQTMHSLPDIVKAITLNNKLDESRDFATLVQRSMVDRLAAGSAGTRDLGVKQAPFVVLIGAGMPSVLAEISFVTHQQEGRLLKTGAYRQKIAEALYRGVAEYQRSLKTVRTVARQ